MTISLLLDLDDTLLTNDLDTFLSAYLKLLSQEINHIPAREMITQLLASTEQMVRNDDPRLTLEEVFDQSFYRGIGKTKAELKATIERFYSQSFPTLQKLTQTRPEARQVVEYALEQGFQIAIATNPLFPQSAIFHRLSWAGLPFEQYPFSVVTTYERMHFSKPNPAYYAETIAQMGWLEQPAVMVGNSLQDDIAPAQALGLPVFYISDNSEGFVPAHPSSRWGSLSEVIPWLEEIQRADLQIEYDSTAALFAILKSTPAALDTLTHDLPAALWQAAPAEGEWGITEILCHLRDVDQEVNWVRLQQVTRQRNPFLPGEVTDPWAQERNYKYQDGISALAAFADIRMRLVQLLDSISLEDWQLPARHAIFGPTNLYELVKFITQHDRNHVCQAKQSIDIVKKKLHDEKEQWPAE